MKLVTLHVFDTGNGTYGRENIKPTISRRIGDIGTHRIARIYRLHNVHLSNVIIGTFQESKKFLNFLFWKSAHFPTEFLYYYSYEVFNRFYQDLSLFLVWHTKKLYSSWFFHTFRFKRSNVACSIVCFVVTYTFSSQNLLLKTDYNKNKYGRSLLTLVQIKK